MARLFPGPAEAARQKRLHRAQQLQQKFLSGQTPAPLDFLQPGQSPAPLGLLQSARTPAALGLLQPGQSPASLGLLQSVRTPASLGLLQPGQSPAPLGLLQSGHLQPQPQPVQVLDLTGETQVCLIGVFPMLCLHTFLSDGESTGHHCKEQEGWQGRC